MRPEYGRWATHRIGALSVNLDQAATQIDSNADLKDQGCFHLELSRDVKTRIDQLPALPSESELLTVASTSGFLTDLETCWGQPLRPVGVFVVEPSQLTPLRPCKQHNQQQEPVVDCVVWIVLDPIHKNSIWQYVPKSHHLLQQSPNELACDATALLHQQPYWTALIKAKGLDIRPWPTERSDALVCHPDLLVGTPLQRVFGGSPRVMGLCYEACRPVQGQVDHCWQLNDRRLVVAGWSTETAPNACINLVDFSGHRSRWPLGTARLDRPDVPSALGLGGDGSRYGFLACLEAPQEQIAEIQAQFGSNLQRVSPISLTSLGDVEAAMDVLVDACHWGTTPPEQLPELLREGLGEALKSLRTLHFTHPTNPPQAASEGQITIDVGHDRQQARLQLLQLQSHSFGVESLVTIRRVGPFHNPNDTALPQWLLSLADACGVQIVPIGRNDGHSGSESVTRNDDHRLEPAAASRRSWLRYIQSWGELL